MIFIVGALRWLFQELFVFFLARMSLKVAMATAFTAVIVAANLAVRYALHILWGGFHTFAPAYVTRAFMMVMPTNTLSDLSLIITAGVIMASYKQFRTVAYIVPNLNNF